MRPYSRWDWCHQYDIFAHLSRTFAAYIAEVELGDMKTSHESHPFSLFYFVASKAPNMTHWLLASLTDLLAYERDAPENIQLLSANCQSLIDILTEYYNAWLNLNVSKNVNSANVMAELEKMSEIFTQVPPHSPSPRLSRADLLGCFLCS